LPPKRAHHFVFASNHTLSLRRDGVSDRTLRRHFAILEEFGLLRRHDSPNRKRYARRDPEAGTCLRFGFDLAPLFNRAAEFSTLAEQVTRAAEHLRFLRLRLRVAISRALLRDPFDPIALEIQPLLRRRLSADRIEAQLARLPANDSPAIDTCDDNVGDTPYPSGTDGQNVRHHHRSEKESIDTSHAPPALKAAGLDPIEQAKLLMAECPEASQFAIEPINSPKDIVRHASMLAPMMGIDRRRYAEAERSRGSWAAAATVWIILSLETQPRHSGRYFESLMNGVHRDSFDPWQYLALKAGGKKESRRRCPRTTSVQRRHLLTFSRP
jgi:replication initiation protein RepC